MKVERFNYKTKVNLTRYFITFIARDYRINYLTIRYSTIHYIQVIFKVISSNVI